MRVESIPIEDLLPPLYPVRRIGDEERMAELVRSIVQFGLLHPLVVISEDSKYRILAGHRRYVAVRGLGWEEIPCNVLELNHREASDVTIMENLIREDVNPVDLGWYLRHLVEDDGMTQEQIGERLGKSASWASRYIKLTTIPDEMQAQIQQGNISFRGALELERIENPDVKTIYTREALERGKSTRQIRQEVDYYKKQQPIIDNAVATVQATRQEPSLEPHPLRCVWCGTPAAEAPGNMVWICTRDLEALLTARDEGGQE